MEPGLRDRVHLAGEVASGGLVYRLPLARSHLRPMLETQTIPRSGREE
jgi:hypothetical protein